MMEGIDGAPLTIGSIVGDEEWATGPSFEVRDPGRLSELVGVVATASAAEIDRIVDVARQAQVPWATVSVAERAELIRRAAAALDENASSLAVLMTRENGSVLATSQGELMAAAEALRNAADLGSSLLASDETYTSSASRVAVSRRPYGVVGCIVPWNAPVILTMQKVGPALVAGNAVIVKPSPYAPLAVSVVLRHFAEFFPPGVINVVHGDGGVGAALISHPAVRKVSFTGGPETARAIMRSASESLTKIHFELGGNDPAIVLDDADLEFAVDKIADGAFRRAGQVCFAVKRVYVPRALAAEFGERMLEKVGRIAVGHGLDPSSSMGPLNNKLQLDKIIAIQNRLDAAGAGLRLLGSKVDAAEGPNGYYVQPAIVLDADPDDDIVTQEQFGPVLPLVSYESEEHAIAMANGTEYGLGSSVWSRDPERALALSAKIEAGMTFINGHGLTKLGRKHVPFGGVKQSGVGWENSAHGMQEYLEFHSTDLHLSEVQK